MCLNYPDMSRYQTETVLVCTRSRPTWYVFADYEPTTWQGWDTAACIHEQVYACKNKNKTAKCEPPHRTQKRKGAYRKTLPNANETSQRHAQTNRFPKTVAKSSLTRRGWVPQKRRHRCVAGGVGGRESVALQKASGRSRRPAGELAPRSFFTRRLIFHQREEASAQIGHRARPLFQIASNLPRRAPIQPPPPRTRFARCRFRESTYSLTQTGREGQDRKRRSLFFSEHDVKK